MMITIMVMVVAIMMMATMTTMTTMTEMMICSGGLRCKCSSAGYSHHSEFHSLPDDLVHWRPEPECSKTHDYICLASDCSVP